MSLRYLFIYIYVYGCAIKELHSWAGISLLWCAQFINLSLGLVFFFYSSIYTGISPSLRIYIVKTLFIFFFLSVSILFFSFCSVVDSINRYAQHVYHLQCFTLNHWEMAKLRKMSDNKSNFMGNRKTTLLDIFFTNDPKIQAYCVAIKCQFIELIN